MFNESLLNCVLSNIAGPVTTYTVTIIQLGLRLFFTIFDFLINIFLYKSLIVVSFFK